MFKRNIFLRHLPYQAPFDDSGSAGGFDGGDGGQAIASPSPAPAPVAAPAPAGPASMLDAITQGLETGGAPAPAPASGQPRDEAGRFTFKDSAGNAVDAHGALAPDQAAALAAQAAAAPKLGADGKPLPAAEEDITQMPEGLGGKAQERFQKLANTNKELSAKLDEVLPGVQAMQTIWQENQVKPEQFEQAMTVVGMINRGDLDGAQRVLMDQLQQISLMTGQPLHVDPLAEFPELRQRVNSLLISEEDAIQLARANRTQTLQQQNQQRQTQLAQQEQQAQQVRIEATNAVDAFCKQMQASDLDYSAIEAKLLPVLPQILDGVPPARWADVVKTQYKLIKDVAGSRGGAPTGGQPLRATGQASPSAAPKTMMQAMFPNG